MGKGISLEHLKKEIGSRLAEARKLAGFKSVKSAIEQLGDNIQSSTLYSYEGGFCLPPIDMIITLGEAYNVSPAYLTGMSSHAGGVLSLNKVNQSYDLQIEILVTERNHAASNGWYDKAANLDIQIEAFKAAKCIANSGNCHI